MTNWDNIFDGPNVTSPCTGLCRCNDEDVCIGCGRTRNDIATWIMMSDQEKIECKKLCKIRLEKIKSNE